MNSEELMISYLKRRLSGGKPVYHTVPADRPPQFVTVQRTGGSGDRFLDRPVFAIQAWAESDYKAAKLADEIRDYLPDIVGEQGVSAWHGSSVYAWPDPLAKHSRYQIVTELTVQLHDGE